MFSRGGEENGIIAEINCNMGHCVYGFTNQVKVEGHKRGSMEAHKWFPYYNVSVQFYRFI